MSERSPEARQLAERALLWLLWELKDTAVTPITLGGLVPEVLTGGQEFRVPGHLGTTDVDLHVSAAILEDLSTARELEDALLRASFEPDPASIHGWQWRVRVGGVSVRIDLLTEDEGKADNHVIRVSERFGVLNLRGTGFVARDFGTETLRGELRSGEDVEMPARFAGLGGYLLAKLVSARVRGKDKDFYDLVYVIRFNREGGARQAAAAIRGGPLGPEIRGLVSTLREVGERFRDEHSVGARAYAAEYRKVDPGADAAQLAADAVSDVAAFLGELRRIK